MLVALAAVLAIAGNGSGQSPPVPGRTDADRASVPAGVVAQLGSERFRYGGLPVGYGGSPTDPIVFSPDGKVLACGHTGGVSVFDAKTGRVLHHLSLGEARGHPGAPQLVRFLADGERLAVGTGGADGVRVTFFKLSDGRPAASPDLAGQRATPVNDVTPDGTRVLLVEWLQRAYLWDLKAGRELWSCEHPGGTAVLPLTADGKWFALAEYAASQLRDAATGKVAARFPDPGRPFADVQLGRLAPDGRLALGSRSGDAVAVLTARAPAAARTLPAGGPVGRFAFSVDGRYLAGAGRYATEVWDLRGADAAGPVARLPAASTAEFSPDAKVLALADEGYVALYSVGDWKPLPQAADPPSPVYRLRVTDDGKRVLGLTRGGWLSWPVGGGPAVPMPDGLTGIRARGYMGTQVLADASADGRVAVDLVRLPGKGPFDGPVVVSVVDAAGGEPRTIPVGYVPDRPLALTPDGRYASVSRIDRETRVWDTRTGEVVFREKRAKGEWVLGVQPAADGRSLLRSVVGTWAGGTGDGPSFTRVRVTDHITGRAWEMSPMPWRLNDGVRFSRDGTRILGRGRYDNVSTRDTVSVWDTQTGQRLVAWAGESDDYGEAQALSADNRSLLVGDRTGRLTVVEAATGAERARFEHRGPVLAAAFVPDGSRAVGASLGTPVYVWDLIGKPGPWDAAKAEAVWADLASPDAKVAFAAIRRLRANLGEAVPFLEARVRLPAAPADGRVARWLRDLDAPRFAVREQAQRELTAAADLIRPKLEAARAKATFEAGRRLDQVLKGADGWTQDQLRHLRACEVLEGVRTPDAVRVLKAWAGGPPGARLTVEAKESAGRLGR